MRRPHPDIESADDDGSFVGVFAGLASGALVYKFKRIKPFIILGTCITILSSGLMTRFSSDTPRAELAGIQTLRGIGLGFIFTPILAHIQSASLHENLAIVTATAISISALGGALGSTIGGAIWQAQLPQRLLEAVGGDETTATSIFADPLAFVFLTPWDLAPELRTALAKAYSDTQRVILIVSVSISAVVLVLACCLGNPRCASVSLVHNEDADAGIVGDEVTLEEKEDKAESETEEKAGSVHQGVH